MNGRRWCGRRASARRVVAAVCLVGGLCLAQAAPAAAGFFLGDTIDGPGPDIVSLGNVALSRDGTGGVVYVRRAAGIDHVFASISSGGAWGPPEQVDVGLAGAGSQPVIAAADKGRLAVVFINGGTLYGAVRASGSSNFFTAPQPIASAASNPALGISINDTAYASYTAPDNGVGNVWVARLDRTSTLFTAFGQPLDLDPTRNAATTPATRSSVAVSTDGSALVTWGEDGADGHRHVGVRRVSSQGISNAPQDLTLTSLDGRPGGAADSPRASVQDASDFGWVAFRQTFFDGATAVSRVIARRQLGSEFETPVEIDSLAFPTSGTADYPQIAVNGHDGDGVATLELGSHQMIADPLRAPDFQQAEPLNSAANTIAPLPVIGLGEDDHGAVAWQQSSGPTDPASVHARAFDGFGFGPDALISRPQFGPADGLAGLSATADRNGDVLVAFVQGGPGNMRIVAGGLAPPPADFSLLTRSRFTNKGRPLIAWTASNDPIGLAGYQVYIDGKLVGTTRRTSFVPRAAIPDGAHSLTVAALDHYGQMTDSPTIKLRVDTRPPRATLSIGGTRASGQTLSFSVRASDGPRATASGVGTISISFGDGSAAGGGRATHRYGRPGTYSVRVVVRDRAGNARVLRQSLRIG